MSERMKGWESEGWPRRVGGGGGRVRGERVRGGRVRVALGEWGWESEGWESGKSEGVGELMSGSERMRERSGKVIHGEKISVSC